MLKIIRSISLLTVKKQKVDNSQINRFNIDNNNEKLVKKSKKLKNYLSFKTWLN